MFTIFNKNKKSDSLIEIINKFNKTRLINTNKYLCNAPFRNLYFNIDGKVTACCFNTKYVLGDITKNSIIEIWNGEKLKELRNAILNNNLNLGCDICASELKLNNFKNIHIKYFDENFKINELPTSLMFQINNLCNLECTMCTGDFSSSILKRREFRNNYNSPYTEKFFNELFSILPNVKQCMFSGGEPFLIEQYYDIWNEIIKINPKCLITVQTNGTIVNSKVKEILARGNFKIGISLDSLDSENFKNIRVNANLNEVLSNVEFFRNQNSKNNQYTNVSVCVMKQNWHEIPLITKYLSEKNLIVFYNTVNFPAKDAIWVLKSSEIMEVIKLFRNAKLPSKTKIQKQNIISFINYLKIIEKWYNVSLQLENNTPKIANKELIVELENKIYKKINDTIAHYYNNSKNNINLISSLKNILNNTTNDENKLTALQIIDTYSGEKIVANFFRETDESLNLLVKNLAKFKNLNV